MFRYIKLGLFLMIISLFFAPNSFSQKNTVKLEGGVTDQQGNPAGNATLLATNVDTGYSAKTVTDNQGRYIFRNMPSGRYKIKLVGEGGRGGDITVDAEILPGYDYLLRFSNWQKGELVPFIREGEVKFVVTDKKGKLITNAVVKFTVNAPMRVQDQNDKLVAPDDDGYFPITINGEIVTFVIDPRFPISLEIKAIGYKSQTKNVELKPDESIVLNFRLKKGR